MGVDHPATARPSAAVSPRRGLARERSRGLAAVAVAMARGLRIRRGLVLFSPGTYADDLPDYSPASGAASSEAGLPLAVRLWDGAMVGAPRGPSVTITVRHPLALAALGRSQLGGLARELRRAADRRRGPIRDVVRRGRGAVRRRGCGAAAGGRRLAPLGAAHAALRQQGDPQPLRRQRRFLRPLARPAAGLLLRLFPPGRRYAGDRAGAEARSHLPQAAARARRALPRHRLRLGRARHVGGRALSGARRSA